MLLKVRGTTPSPQNHSGSTATAAVAVVCTAGASPITVAASRLNPFIAPMPQFAPALLPVSFFGYSRRSHAGLGSRALTFPWAVFIRPGNAYTTSPRSDTRGSPPYAPVKRPISSCASGSASPVCSTSSAEVSTPLRARIS